MFPRFPQKYMFTVESLLSSLLKPIIKLNTHPVPFQILSCYREVCSYYLQNMCKSSLSLQLSLVCNLLQSVRVRVRVCVRVRVRVRARVRARLCLCLRACVCVDGGFAKQQVGRSAVNSAYAWVCLHYERVVCRCALTHIIYPSLSLSLRPPHTHTHTHTHTLSLSIVVLWFALICHLVIYYTQIFFPFSRQHIFLKQNFRTLFSSDY